MAAVLGGPPQPERSRTTASGSPRHRPRWTSGATGRSLAKTSSTTPPISGMSPRRKSNPGSFTSRPNHLLLQLRAWASGVLRREDLWFSEIPAAAVAPEIGRDVRAEVLRRVLDAVRTRRALSVRYQSLTNSRWRDIAPHAIAFDGHRWHARAWCCDRQEFRDFVLTRIERLGRFKPVSFEPEHDLEWSETVKLRLCPHPGLTEEQSQAVQRDYDMREGVREIEVRLALGLLFY